MAIDGSLKWLLSDKGEMKFSLEAQEEAING
jgi:hypothetical protein